MNKPVSLKFLETARSAGISAAFAESITAGNLTSELVQYPGASAVLRGGVTAYSNEVKRSVLGVQQSTLDAYGAVSSQTVTEMLKGLSEQIRADIYAAVSGVAGPDGGTVEKPVGTVDIGFMFRDKLTTERVIFSGTREEIIKACVEHVYTRLLEEVEKACSSKLQQ